MTVLAESIGIIAPIAPDDPDIGRPAEFAPILCATQDVDTFALLDAAKVPNLAEMIATSGLEHRCLYRNAEAEGLADVAPDLRDLSISGAG